MSSDIWEISFVPKSKSKLMGLIGLVMPEAFHLSFWTTIGSTIYVPKNAELGMGTSTWHERHAGVIEHEVIHAVQFRTWGILLMALGYLGPAAFVGPVLGLLTALGLVAWWLSLAITVALMPLSFGLAYFRWRIEREAFAHDIMMGRVTVSQAADLLDRYYGKPWPRSWMQNWFEGS